VEDTVSVPEVGVVFGLDMGACRDCGEVLFARPNFCPNCGFADPRDDPAPAPPAAPRIPDATVAAEGLPPRRPPEPPRCSECSARLKNEDAKVCGTCGTRCCDGCFVRYGHAAGLCMLDADSEECCPHCGGSL
jgi:membrane protease subunit (stomatin/prohibitin family)